MYGNQPSAAQAPASQQTQYQHILEFVIEIIYTKNRFQRSIYHAVQVNMREDSYASVARSLEMMRPCPCPEGHATEMHFKHWHVWGPITACPWDTFP